MSVIEVTLVITVLLSLISILLIGISAYKQGADRAVCIRNISAAQQAMRAYSNLAGHYPGKPVTNLQAEVIGPGRYMESVPSCPANGVYDFGPDVIPDLGTLYMSCSIGHHLPADFAGW